MKRWGVEFRSRPESTKSEGPAVDTAEAYLPSRPADYLNRMSQDLEVLGSDEGLWQSVSGQSDGRVEKGGSWYTGCVVIVVMHSPRRVLKPHSRLLSVLRASSVGPGHASSLRLRRGPFLPGRGRAVRRRRRKRERERFCIPCGWIW